MISLKSAQDFQWKWDVTVVYEFVAFLYFQLLSFSCIFQLGAPFNS